MVIHDDAILIVAPNNKSNNNICTTNVGSILPSWRVGEDTAERHLEMGSKGAGIFRQERKVTKVDEMGEKKKEKECSGLVSAWGLYQVSIPCSSYLWNRDINAAINIVNIYLHLLEYNEVP